MELTKYKLGKLIEQCDNRNTDEEYTADDVRGISTGKEFIETKANMDGVSLTSYKIVKENGFAYVADTSRRGDKIAVAFNRNEGNILISSIYTVFYVSNPELLLSDYLFMFFNRSEFDRYSRFNSWGSARETFSWEDMCDIEIDLPPLPIQQKYVDIYNAMLANQQSYERGLEDLKLVCDAYIEDLRRSIEVESIGPYIVPCDERNGEKISIAYRDKEDCVVSSAYQVFEIKEKKRLIPEYLMMWFKRSEFDRYARYMSKGSAHEFFEYTDMEEVAIPIPDIEIQISIANIYHCYMDRRDINEKLKAQIKAICPILIKGSIEEAKKTKEA